MIKRILVGITVLAMIFVLASCNGEIDNSADQTVKVFFEPTTALTKNISVSTSGSDVKNLYWSYTATKNGGGQVGAASEPKAFTAADPGLSGTTFSVGTWNFTLYGFSSDTIRDAANTKDLAESKYIYKATGSSTIKFSSTPQTVSLAATTSTTADSGNEVTATLALDSNISANYSVKYKWTETKEGETNKYRTSSDTTRIGSQEVTLGLFESVSATEPVATKQFTVTLFRGLTTTIGGTWEDPSTTANFSIGKPCSVKFVSIFSGDAVVQSQMVDYGTYITAPTTPTTGTTYTDNGVSYTFYKWVKDLGNDATYKYDSVIDADSAIGSKSYNFEGSKILSDITLHAVWVKSN